MQEQKTIHTSVLSIYRELAEAFTEPLKTDQQSSALTIDKHQVVFEIVAGDPDLDPTFEERVAPHHAIAIVARFLDVLSLDKIKMIYRRLPDNLRAPMAIFLLRDKDEVDFKISCPSCGQKLWLRDSDVNKRGRCPNCKKPFIILSQADHLKSQLVLPDNVPVVTLIRNDAASFQAVMAQLLGALTVGLKPATEEMTAEALKNLTVRVQIQDA
ncbi:MAG: hypothetical protein GX806_02000 [Lentisphaerae bacterium]|nr:hypothetical protein [Lentisphaerota bacterium]